MDRIYTHFDSDVNLFRNYGKEKGWPTYYDNKKLSHDMAEYYQVDLKNVKFDNYPYVDTFCVIDLDNKKAHSAIYNKNNRISGLSSNLIQIRNSNGTYYNVF